jgi:superoxide dismutase
LAACCCCRHGPKRADYLNDFWKVLSWQAVSSNYADAQAGNVQNIVA